MTNSGAPLIDATFTISEAAAKVMPDEAVTMDVLRGEMHIDSNDEIWVISVTFEKTITFRVGDTHNVKVAFMSERPYSRVEQAEEKTFCLYKGPYLLGELRFFDNKTQGSERVG